MITDIRIENFKNFERFEFSGFKRVNLLAGKNNVGKTNLMEAIYLLMTDLSPGAILGFYGTRLQVQLPNPPYSNASETQVALDILDKGLERAFFQNSGSILLKSSQKPSLRLERVNYLENPQRLDSQVEFTFKLSEPGRFNPENPKKGLAAYRGEGKESEIIFTRIHGFNFNPSLPPISSPLPSFLHPHLFGLAGMNKQFQDLYKAGKMRGLQEILSKVFGIQVVNIQLLDEGYPERKVPYLEIKDLGVIPLGELGFGSNRLFALLLVLYKSENSAVFLDEIDLGIHHSLIPKVWKTLFELAVELNVQIFATTHSRDCTEAFARVSQEFAGEGLFLRLEEYKGNIHAIGYSEEEILIAAESQYEVR